MDRRSEMDVEPSGSTTKIQEHMIGSQSAERASRDTGDPLLSFVIPAFNEELFIARTIGAIHEFVPQLSYEIIVVDNGSTDGTQRIALEFGAILIVQPWGTIGSLRNRGVASARGAILVFLDADVVLTPEWAARIPATVELLGEDPATLTGAMCNVPADASWLERYWFAPRQKSSHIGSGHMVITRNLFNELGGFDESLATGEDYDLSRRAVAHGGRIASDDRLRVEHLGFPRTIGAFIQRETWHGVGDYESLSLFLRSKVAILAAVFALLHGVAFASLVTGAVWGGVVAGLAVAALCLMSSYRQYRSQASYVILLNAGVFWVYYLGRALAFTRRIGGLYSRGSR